MKAFTNEKLHVDELNHVEANYYVNKARHLRGNQRQQHISLLKSGVAHLMNMIVSKKSA